jgi:hypothetical protein
VRKSEVCSFIAGHSAGARFAQVVVGVAVGFSGDITVGVDPSFFFRRAEMTDECLEIMPFASEVAGVE